MLNHSSAPLATKLHMYCDYRDGNVFSIAYTHFLQMREIFAN